MTVLTSLGRLLSIQHRSVSSMSTHATVEQAEATLQLRGWHEKSGQASTGAETLPGVQILRRG